MAQQQTVLIGGPYASLSPDVVRPHCDILVRGEIEEIAPTLFADFQQTFLKSVLAGYAIGCGLGFVVAIAIDRSPFLKGKARALRPPAHPR